MDQEMGLMIIAPPAESNQTDFKSCILEASRSSNLEKLGCKAVRPRWEGGEFFLLGGRRVMLAIKSTCLPDHTATTTLLQRATNLPPDLRIFAAFF